MPAYRAGVGPVIMQEVATAGIPFRAYVHQLSEVTQASSRSSLSRLGLRHEIPAVDRFRDGIDHGNTTVLLQRIFDGHSVPLHPVPVDGDGASGTSAKLVRGAINDSDARITALRRTGRE